MFEPEEVSKEGGVNLILVSTADYSNFYCMFNPGLVSCNLLKSHLKSSTSGWQI